MDAQMDEWMDAGPDPCGTGSGLRQEEGSVPEEFATA
jgi:hypothetical protein